MDGEVMTREERLDWLCRLRGQLIYFNMPDHWRTNFIHALSDEINDLQQETCDCISRAEALKNLALTNSKDDVYRMIQELPPVTPQPKTGHWIEKDGFDGDTYYNCSECGESWTTIEGTPWSNGMKFCPNCGAKMLPTDLQFGDQDTLMSAT